MYYNHRTISVAFEILCRISIEKVQILKIYDSLSESGESWKVFISHITPAAAFVLILTKI